MASRRDGRRDGDEGCDDGWDEEEWRGRGAVARDDRLAHADDDGDVWLPGRTRSSSRRSTRAFR